MFIVLEGGDGSGKSTHSRMLAEWLKEQGRKVHLTAEPTPGRIGQFIREILSGEVEVSPRTLALLFTADRAEHVREIEEALSEGNTVVCDRYYHSTIAYQSAQGVSREWLIELNSFAPEPDLVVFLDVEARRGALRTSTGEVFEKKEFLEKIREEYMKFKGLKVIDTSRPKEKVQEDIRKVVGELL
ncbi:MAG: dTMP kinase [Candidatus Altiarchaeales archaeon]|nr:dTMP kinase [Candidatus Altiarchaeales archaeon]MBD3416944.1 dTMP kinase [Candidatus Altiarchaeales archaeon]